MMNPTSSGCSRGSQNLKLELLGKVSRNIPHTYLYRECNEKKQLVWSGNVFQVIAHGIIVRDLTTGKALADRSDHPEGNNVQYLLFDMAGDDLENQLRFAYENPAGGDFSSDDDINLYAFFLTASRDMIPAYMLTISSTRRKGKARSGLLAVEVHYPYKIDSFPFAVFDNIMGEG